MRFRFSLIIGVVGLALATAGCNELAEAIVWTGSDAGDDDLLGEGEDCSAGGECEEGLTCGHDGTCQTDGDDGTTPEDGPCVSDAYCAFGLVCAADGTCQQPGEDGTAEAGDDCGEDADCVFGLECLDGVCTGFQVPYWPGVTCQDPAEYGDEFKAFFDVKGETGDFYALPFPNDIRRPGGKIDLSGHPNPGILIEALGNPIDDYFDVVQNDLDGFGTNSCAYFRFSRWIDGETLVNQENVLIVDITPTSLEYGQLASNGYSGDRVPGRYICWNWLAVCPSIGRPLKPGTTYAAIVLDSITDEEGNPLAQDSNFSDMLLTAEPPDVDLVDAWNAYAPLRDFLADDSVTKTFGGSDIAAAAVFTTQTSIWDRVPNMRTAVRAEAAPAVQDLATDTSDAAYTLYTGALTVPFYQEGTRPFRTPADGGAIAYDGAGLPIFVEEESVRFALTVPAGAEPVGGWPILIYAHGTGGSEASFVDEGIADRMAALGVAVIGVEQVMHGDRRGLDADEADLEVNDPGRLFYNFLNPRAARDSNLQAAADHFQVTRLIEDFAAISGVAVSFDAAAILFFGHSQGSQGPMLFAAHEPAVKMVILSGAGGYLLGSFLEKKNPIDVASAMRVAIADPFASERSHPLLNLVQAAFDDVDPVNHAQAVFRADRADYQWPGADSIYPHRQVFMSYGVGDTYSPETTQLALAKNLWVSQWPLDPDNPLQGIDVIPSLPHTATKTYDGEEITAVVVQYEPDGDYDAHFVMFEHPDAISQLDSFVQTYLADGVPSLLEP